MFIPTSVKHKYNEEKIINPKRIKTESNANTNKEENKQFSLFDYALDNSKSEDECDSDDDSVVEFSRNQRYPKVGEPVCIVCGRYGEYICDETNKDVCSLECKKKHLQSLKDSNSSQNEQSLVPLSNIIINYTEHQEISKLTEEQVEGIRNSLFITVKGNNIPKPSINIFYIF